MTTYETDHAPPKTDRERIVELEAELESARTALDRLRLCLEASEDWRKAYENGKLKLYAMGGDVCEAAATHLPCGEGPLNLEADFLLGVRGLKSMIVELREENKCLRESPTQECTTCERYFLEVLMRKDANGLLFCEPCFAALERECAAIDAAMANPEGRG